MNVLKICYTDDEYYQVEVRKRSDGRSYKFVVYVPGNEHRNKIRNITSRIRVRDIIKSYSWARIKFVGEGMTKDTVKELFH